MYMSSLFTVSLRKAKFDETILPEDHNQKVDAVKEILSVAKETVEWIMAR